MVDDDAFVAMLFQVNVDVLEGCTMRVAKGGNH